MPARTRAYPADVILSQSKRKQRVLDKKDPSTSTNKDKNLSVWFRDEEKAELEAYAEKNLEKPGPLARRVVLLYVRGKLVPRES